MERDFKGVWIPKEVWLDERLSALDKIILVEIDSLDNGDKGCFASNQYLAEFCQCSERKVRDAISKLKKYNYIHVENFDGRKRFIQSTWQNLPRRVAKSATQGGKNCQAGWQNLPHNNIDNNISNNIDDKERKKRSGSFDSVFENKNVSDQLKEAFVEFIKSRKLNNHQMTDKALELAIDKVRKLESDEERQIAVIYQSIENGWRGLFPLKEMPEVKNKAVYKPRADEDITWRRLFDFWERALGYRPAETEANVDAAKKLLAEGEDAAQKLIAALGMRSHYHFLTKEIKGVSDIASLYENREHIWAFYSQHQREWAEWSGMAKQGKNPWEV